MDCKVSGNGGDVEGGGWLLSVESGEVWHAGVSLEARTRLGGRQVILGHKTGQLHKTQTHSRYKVCWPGV